MKFYQTKKFKHLSKKWASKLERSGFEDIEDGENYLKSWESFQGRLVNNAYVESKSEYYRMARQFLEGHTFKTKKEKKIFEMHTEGLGYRKIAKKTGTYKNKIAQIIQGLVKVMRARP